MKPTPAECARLDAATVPGNGPCLPPALPGLADVPDVEALMRYRRARLARR